MHWKPLNPPLRAKLLIGVLVLGICGIGGYLLGQSAGHQVLLAQPPMIQDTRAPQSATPAGAHDPALQVTPSASTSNDGDQGDQGNQSDQGNQGHHGHHGG